MPRSLLLAGILLAATGAAVAQKPPTRKAAKPDPRLAALKKEAIADVDGRAKFTANLVDQIFSFGELGFQEVETTKLLVTLLRKEGFTIQEGYAGIPTAFVARWGSGKPIISLGADIDGIPQSSQMPGVACRLPIVPNSPGHGEGHNAGPAVIVTAALAVKRLMEKEKLAGTIQLWPGVAEELLGTKAYFVRAGLFRDVDAAIFAHVDDNFATDWGQPDYTGIVSVQYAFRGISAHSAGAPWRGRSALDAVELMNIGWNYRREHLGLQHRSHYIIRDGGDQPNVVPNTASVWYYVRETTYPKLKELWAMTDSVAAGAAMMTGTRLESMRVLGTAWPPHFNKPLAEALYANILEVGSPQWSEDDQTFAKALQKELGQEQKGLNAKPDSLGIPPKDIARKGGGSDDIGDVSWVTPTVTIRFPSNIPGTPGHNWADGIAMATPVAHKGATAGAKATAMTMVDLLLKPELIQNMRAYFDTVQTKTQKYEPLIRPDDKPAIELNTAILERYRPQMRPFYFDPSRYSSYLEQLGVRYPTVRAADGSCGPKAVP